MMGSLIVGVVCGLCATASYAFGFFTGRSRGITETESRWSDAVGRTCQQRGCPRMPEVE